MTSNPVLRLEVGYIVRIQMGSAPTTPVANTTPPT
jgi:hypothetical protein